MGARQRGGEEENRGWIPREMLLAMITQFVAYGMGEMSEEDKKQFPEGWHKKYWECLPPGYPGSYQDYIHGKIGKNQFWKGIRESSGGMK